MNDSTCAQPHAAAIAAAAITLVMTTAAHAGTPPPVPDNENWRSTRPEQTAPRPPALPTFQKTKLSNGLTLFVAVEKALPLVSFQLVIKGGSNQDPADKPGVTSLMFNMLEEGAGDYDALAFSDRVADLGASFGGGAGRDECGIGISGLTRNAKAMLGLLSDAALRPRFGAEDFDRLKERTLATLVRRRGSPQGLASDYMPPVLYGADHPYGHPVTGTIESVKTLSLADVKAQYEQMFAPRHAAVIVVGDIDLETAQKQVESAFGAWDRTGGDLRAVPSLAPQRRREIVLINKPGAAQTFTMMGRPVFGRGHPDEVPLTLANAVFGGTFASRLNMNLREDKGYTYGANSAVAFRTGTGVLLGYAALQQNVTAAGLKEFFGELKTLKKRPPTEDEVGDAKAGRVRSLTGQFQRIGAIAGAASALFIYDLPLDHFAELPNRYSQASLEAVRRAAVEYFDPAVMKVLLVGDAKVVSRQLKKAGYNRVKVIDPPGT